jgi:RimJ/RimL family protein N-acetyltransferase
MKEILRTSRLHLRCFDKNDAVALLPILSDKAVMRFSMTGIMNETQVENAIKSWIQAYEQDGFSPWALIYENKLIGYAGLDKRIVEDKERVQITMRIAQNYWGKGFATEIGEAILEFAFTKLNLKEVIAIVDPENKASIAFLANIGMKFSKAVVYGGLNLRVYSAQP